MKSSSNEILTKLYKALHQIFSKFNINRILLQLEDAEFARTAAMKARQNAELELADVQVRHHCHQHHQHQHRPHPPLGPILMGEHLGAA